MKKTPVFAALIIISAFSYSQYINDTLSVKIELMDSIYPDSTKLEQNYPNPFCGNTDFKFSISEKTFYVFSMFDSSGVKIADFFNKELEPGKYSLSWNGSKFGKGVYFYQLKSGNFTATKKYLLIK